MKHVPELKDWENMVAEKRKIMEDQAVDSVIRHTINMQATKQNAGVRDAYRAYQNLLPFEYRQHVPVITMPTLAVTHSFHTFKAAKELMTIKNNIEMIMTDEIKVARDQYLIMLRLAR